MVIMFIFQMRDKHTSNQILADGSQLREGRWHLFTAITLIFVVTISMVAQYNLRFKQLDDE